MNNIKFTEEDIIGKILPNGKIEKEYKGQGWIYKNPVAFQSKSDEVCYVPEYSGNGINIDEVFDESKYTQKDFVRIAQEFINNNEDVKTYCEEEGVTAEDIAIDIFETVDWQHPESLIGDWEMSGAYTE
jgi:hypothetical protein